MQSLHLDLGFSAIGRGSGIPQFPNIKWLMMARCRNDTVAKRFLYEMCSLQAMRS